MSSDLIAVDRGPELRCLKKLFWPGVCVVFFFMCPSCSGTVSSNPDAGLDANRQDGMSDAGSGDDSMDGGGDLSDGGQGADEGDTGMSDGGDSVSDASGGDDGGIVVQRTLPAVSVQPGGISYWDTPYFCDALAMGGEWIEYSPGDWGQRLDIWQNPQFDSNGLPQYLDDGKLLRALVYGLHVKDNRSGMVRGHVVLTWKGIADVRLNSGYEYVQDESSGAETGALTDGRRVYRYTDAHLEWLEVHEIDQAKPITELHVWLPDPQDPTNRSLEDEVFYPLFLDRLADRDWGFIRFMDWLETNASPVQDWSDRRLPAHVFQTGVLNPRAPANGFNGNRSTGVAFEYLVMLCNITGLDLWVNVPHLATDDFVTKLAQLIRFGSDGHLPYASHVDSPVFAPLRSDLRVFVEYSNEIWSWGDSFCQGEWAYEQAQAQGITKPQFNARRASRIWSIFGEVFGGDSRVVKVAAVQASNMGYTIPFLEELRDYGATLDPAVEPDIISPTTYFGNGIQDFVYQQTWLDGVENNDSYWSSPEHEAHVQAAFDEWTRRLLSGDAQAGAGPDATGIGGGFPEQLHQQAKTLFSTQKPLVAYEGGPSIYTNQIEDSDPVEGPLVTRFMESMNRHPRMAEVYGIHLNMALSHGLTTHNPFVLVSSWGKYGQWGHLEHLDQDPAQSVKYQFLLSWAQEAQSIRSIDDPHGSIPSFVTDFVLAPMEVGVAGQVEIEASEPDGSVVLDVIGSSLSDGLAIEPVEGTSNKILVIGTPHDDITSYIYVRATDQDGDAAWRTFSLNTFGGPGTVVECDFTGSNPSLNLPWTKTYFLAQDLSWSGWQAGAGINVEQGDNGLFFSVSSGADEDQSTLSLALTDEEYWSATISVPDGQTIDLRQAHVRFSVRRIDYHAPRRFAFMTSVGGFSAGNEVFSSERNTSSSDTEYSFEVPDDPSYQALSGDVEVRIVPFAAQYSGHKMAMISFKLRSRQ